MSISGRTMRLETEKRTPGILNVSPRFFVSIRLPDFTMRPVPQRAGICRLFIDGNNNVFFPQPVQEGQYIVFALFRSDVEFI